MEYKDLAQSMKADFMQLWSPLNREYNQNYFELIKFIVQLSSANLAFFISFAPLPKIFLFNKISIGLHLLNIFYGLWIIKKHINEQNKNLFDIKHAAERNFTLVEKLGPEAAKIGAEEFEAMSIKANQERYIWYDAITFWIFVAAFIFGILSRIDLIKYIK